MVKCGICDADVLSLGYAYSIYGTVCCRFCYGDDITLMFHGEEKARQNMLKRRQNMKPVGIIEDITTGEAVIEIYPKIADMDECISRLKSLNKSKYE